MGEGFDGARGASGRVLLALAVWAARCGPHGVQELGEGTFPWVVCVFSRTCAGKRRRSGKSSTTRGERRRGRCWHRRAGRSRPRGVQKLGERILPRVVCVFSRTCAGKRRRVGEGFDGARGASKRLLLAPSGRSVSAVRGAATRGKNSSAGCVRFLENLRGEASESGGRVRRRAVSVEEAVAGAGAPVGVARAGCRN